MTRANIAARAVRAVRGRGLGYEPQLLGGRFRRGEIAGYFLDLRAKTVANVDPDALLPASLAQLALGWWERLIDGERAAGDSFDRVVQMIHGKALRADGHALWPYDLDVPKYGIRRPWFSAMAQGQLASVLVRAATRGDVQAAEAARAAVAPLLGGVGPLVRLAAEGPVLQEAPSSPASDILNGWIYALWGLHDVAAGLDADAAALAWRQGVTALVARIDLYDTGSWSLYSLFPGRVRDVAHPFYHRLHVAQLRATALAIDTPELEHVAERWERYDTPNARRKAVALKAAGFFARMQRP